MSAERFELARAINRLIPSGRGHFAVPPFLGYLDRPQRGAGAGLELRGWVFDRDVPIVELGATSQGGPETRLRHGLPRPDLEERFAGEPRALCAGFEGELPLAYDPGNAGDVQIWARLADGRRLVCFRARPAVARRPFAWLRERWAHRRLLRRFEAILGAAAAGDAPELPAAAPEILDALFQAYRSSGGLSALERDLMRASSPAEPRVVGLPRATPKSEDRRSILIVSSMFPSTEHAGGLRLFDITQALGRRHDVDLYSTYRPDLDQRSLERLRPSLRASRLVDGGRALTASDVRSWLDGRARPAYDVIHFEYPSSTHLIPVLRPYGKKIIFTLIECVTRRLLIDLSLRLRERSPHLGVTARLFLEAFNTERDALHACDESIAVTDDDAAFAVRSFGVRRPMVVPTCLSDSAFLDAVPTAGRQPAGRHTAVFVGFFEHYPNLDAMRWYLQNVHDAVLRRIPDYQLLIVGRGDTTPLRAFAHGPSVQFVGRVDELAPQLQAAQIGLAPIVSGAGIRGKINQYSAVGRPTVSTTLGASGMPYRHEQSILIADAPADFARAVERLLTDEALYRRLQAGARQVAETSFRWGHQIERIESLHG